MNRTYNLNLGTMMDILDIGMRDVTLRPYFTEIFFENGETREFMDRLLLGCRLDDGLTNNLSHRSRKLLLKIFDEPKFLRRELLDKLNIEKLLLLDISARIQNHDGIVSKLHSEALSTGTVNPNYNRSESGSLALELVVVQGALFNIELVMMDLNNYKSI